MPHFDLAVIGSGSGNSVLTEALSGRSVALIEESTFGGTCLNVGCIPTKMLVYAADVADTIRASARYGIDASVDQVRWHDIRNRVFGRIDPISAGGRIYRDESPNVTLFEAHADFDGPRSIRLSTGEEVTADQIVVATGSRPHVPAMVADSGVPFHTSDTIMRIPFLPRRLAILGGGYVGAEFAHIFSALGVEVTLIVRGARLLTHLDDEISDRFTALAQDRWRVLLNTDVTAVERGADGVRVKVRDAAAVDADLLLVATGRIPNSDRMNLAAAGVEVDADGLVQVDDYQRTTADGVWALGDVSSPYQLKHVANQDARVVAHNLAFPHELRESNHRAVPAAVFTEPQIATVGLTEQAAHARGVKYVSAVQHYGFTAFGWALEDTSSVCKLLADPVTQRLLGAHIMGPEASILIQPLIQAIAFGQTVHDVASGQYWIHPALTEVVENALLSLPLDRRLLPA